MTNLNNAAARNLTGEAIVHRMEQHGFVRVSRSDGGAHVLLRRDHVDVVVPGALRNVPDNVVQMIERSLEPALGPNWLTQPHESAPESVPHDEIVILDVIVLEPADDDLWRAFLTDDLTTIGYADSRTGALVDLKSAAALRLGTTTEQVVLVTPEVL